jgi:hypothetical protein
MAGERYTRTNEKIFYAGLALESWRKAEAGTLLNAQALMQAECESALFHLYGGVLGLCHEIAGYYRLPNSEAECVENFLGASTAFVPAPELAELSEMATHKQTWLAQLLAAYASLFRPPEVPRARKDDSTASRIEVLMLAADTPLLPDGATLELWRKELKLLTQRIRSGLSEW